MAASTYFDLICKELDIYTKEHEPAKVYKCFVYREDVHIIKMFCMSLETWDYSLADDEQRKEMFKSIITHLKVIWIEEDHKLDDDLETWPKDIRIFDPVTFELERKIQQSKPQIEKYCQILVRSSSMQMQMQMQQMGCKSSSTNYNNMAEFFQSIRDSVYCFCYYNMAAKIVPFNNLVEELLQFLEDSWDLVRECIDRKELLEYRSFVHVFSYNTACLVCLYWAKESKEETATEIYIALFDMLHKIKSFAADVTVSYIAVLKPDSDHWMQTASFVDFFFEHTILKDHFLILRERLILVFTFLTSGDPHENAQEEKDLIRSQIYASLHEDAYLLLPISEMKQQDFSNNNNMLLSDFINKIDILTAKIIQLYYRASDSWNRREAQKMNNIYFASLHRELSSFRRGKHRMYPCLKELRFLRLFFQCFETWDDSVEETRVRLCSVVTSLQRIWGQEYNMGLFSARLYVIRKEYNDAGWKHLELELQEKFQMSKQEIIAWLVSLSHCSFHCSLSTTNKILKFLDSIIYNMSDLVTFGTCKDVASEKQIEILEEKLLLVRNLLNLTANCADCKILEEFNMLAHAFANNAACLIYMYWANKSNDEIPDETNFMFSNMLQKIKPNTPDVARTYIEILKAICLQPCDCFLLEQTAMSFVDYFFEDLVTPWKNDFQILRDEVIFHLTFIHHHHHHTGNAEEIISRQLDVLYNDVVYGLLPFDDMKWDFFEKKVGLSDFMKNIETQNAKIRQLYCKFPDSFFNTFPRIIGLGFLDCLVQKIRHLMERLISDQKYVPFAKYKIMTFEEELISMTPILNQYLELKDQDDVWLEVVNVLYLAEHVISLCFIFYHLIFHYVSYLPDVVDRIKVVKTKHEKIKECSMYNNSRCMPHLAGRMSTLLEQDLTSEMVGIEEDEKIVIDNITRGTESLDIVSIVGMGGLGKTTLAKKVYGSSLVKSHFNLCAFTYVSQDHDKRRLLLDILRDIVGVDAKTFCLTEDDLAHKLKKCLSRQKYFIVLDDIWNINAWEEVRSSFPDDKNGSRVMFTTRSLEVAKRGQINCTPHRLNFLTEDESWKLLQKKVFHNEMPPPNICDLAKLVSKKCNGLPLAIVVIAGLLARTETSMWIEISKRLSTYLSEEGCTDILELSYKTLPEYLKPCLIYLGGFPEDSSFRIGQVTRLWIAEGFIQESKTKRLNDSAKDYLYELVNRSLIIVDKMTVGEIQTFRVHDLIHDLCQKKCRDGSFFQQRHGTASSSFSESSIYNQYHVSMQNLCNITGDAKLSLANTRSVLYFPLKFDFSQMTFLLRKLRFVQVLYLKGRRLCSSDFAQVISMVDLRHIEVEADFGVQSIPASISNLWNIQSLILTCYEGINLPETLWKMKSLRHVKVHNCKFEVSDDYEPNAYPQLDKVVSFSRPLSSCGKDVEWLLQRLPNVRKLSCILQYKSLDSKVSFETFNFHGKLESMKLFSGWGNCTYLLNFPSTLIKLTLDFFKHPALPWTVISAIAELQCLRILKLRHFSFPGPTWEMEDVTFPNLKYFELCSCNLEQWNANFDSFPCLEHLYFFFTKLKELPPCFGEISSLKKITVKHSPKFESVALGVQEEQMELGNKVELVIIK